MRHVLNYGRDLLDGDFFIFLPSSFLRGWNGVLPLQMSLNVLSNNTASMIADNMNLLVNRHHIFSQQVSRSECGTNAKNGLDRTVLLLD